MAERPRAVEDYDYIGKRLQELREKKAQILQQPEEGEGKFDMRSIEEGGAKLTANEALEVARMFNCNYSNRCGKGASKACLKKGKCLA